MLNPKYIAQKVLINKLILVHLLFLFLNILYSVITKFSTSISFTYM